MDDLDVFLHERWPTSFAALCNTLVSALRQRRQCRLLQQHRRRDVFIILGSDVYDDLGHSFYGVYAITATSVAASQQQQLHLTAAASSVHCGVTPPFDIMASGEYGAFQP